MELNDKALSRESMMKGGKKNEEEMEWDERGWNETIYREERKKSLDAGLVHELGQLR